MSQHVSSTLSGPILAKPLLCIQLVHLSKIYTQALSDMIDKVRIWIPDYLRQVVMEVAVVGLVLEV
jgi:hypothetical protein